MLLSLKLSLQAPLCRGFLLELSYDCSIGWSARPGCCTSILPSEHLFIDVACFFVSLCTLLIVKHSRYLLNYSSLAPAYISNYLSVIILIKDSPPLCRNVLVWRGLLFCVVSNWYRLWGWPPHRLTIHLYHTLTYITHIPCTHTHAHTHVYPLIPSLSLFLFSLPFFLSLTHTHTLSLSLSLLSLMLSNTYYLKSAPFPRPLRK